MALVNQYGYNFLQGRPIHLACNLVKIEACSGNHEQAIKIVGYLINNIEGSYKIILKVAIIAHFVVISIYLNPFNIYHLKMKDFCLLKLM